MTRLTALKRLFVAGLFCTGIVAACRATQPGEAPPLAPRPEPTTPVPSSNPVPGAPDPIHRDLPGTPSPALPPGDAGTTAPSPKPGPVSILTPELRASAQTIAADAGPDAPPPGTDGGARSDTPAPAPDAAVPLDASPIDAYTPELPPVPDAPLAPITPDAGRPY